MKRSQLVMGKPMIYVIVLMMIAILSFWAVTEIRGVGKTKGSLEIENFIVSLNNNLKSLKGYERVKELNLAIPVKVETVCFIDKNKEHDEFVNIELNNAKDVYTDKNVFFYPFKRFFPSKIKDFELDESPLCINTLNGKIKLRLTAMTNKTMMSSAEISDEQKECTSIFYSGEHENKVDVVFLGSEYNSINDFSKDVDNYINNIFLKTAPFSENRDSFNLYRIDSFNELGCEIKGYIICDDYKTKLTASFCPNDFIFVLTDRNKIKDLLLPIRSAAFSNTAFINTADNELVLMHEFAHIFAKLADEYVDENYYEGFDASEYHNCDVAGCSKWELITDNCFEGCTLGKFYRGSEKSIMRNYYKSDIFGIVNENIINKKIEVYK